MSALSGLAGRVPHIAPRLGLTNAALAVLVAGLGAGAFLALRTSSSPSSTVAPRTATAARGVVLSSVSASGTVAAARDLAVNFETSGRVVGVGVRPGDKVAKGDVLGRLDPTDARATLRQAQASLTTARASLLETETGQTAAERESDAVAVAQSNAQIAQAKAQVAQAQTSLKHAKAQLAADERSTQQAIHSAQSTLALKQAQTQLRTDQGNLKAAVAKLAADKAKLTVGGTTYASVDEAVTAWTQTVDQDKAQQQAGTQANYDLQAQQTADQQKLSADQSQLARATSASDKATGQATVDADQNAVSYDAMRLQQQSKLLNQIQYQLAQDQAQLQALQTLQTTITQDQNSIASLEAKIVSDRNQIANAGATRTSQIQNATSSRTGTLTKDRQAITSAQQQVASAKQQVATAKLSLRSTRASNAQKTSVSPATLAQSRAAVVQAEANVATAKQTLAETVLRAPVAGTVSKVGGVVGQSVSGGGTSAASSSSSSTGTGSTGTGSTGSSSFVEIVGLRGLQVTSSFSETDATKLRLGQPGTVTISALPNRKLAAHVVGIDVAGTASSSVVQYTVTLALDRMVAGLKPGMSANVSVTTSERDNVVNIPSAAVNGSGQSGTVTVVDADGTQRTVPVVVGLKGDSATEIISGLSAGQSVVTSSGTTLLTSGAGTSTTGGQPRGGFGGLGGGGAPVGGPAGGFGGGPPGG